MGECGLDEVLGRATQRDEDVVVVRVHRRAAATQVGQQLDRAALGADRELPALRVVLDGARVAQRTNSRASAVPPTTGNSAVAAPLSVPIMAPTTAPTCQVRSATAW